MEARWKPRKILALCVSVASLPSRLPSSHACALLLSSSSLVFVSCWLDVLSQLSVGVEHRKLLVQLGGVCARLRAFECTFTLGATHVWEADSASPWPLPYRGRPPAHGRRLPSRLHVMTPGDTRR